ncbi:MAG: hypothetical protein IBX69_05430 [Anaerolineales bacterium]|nr:hypothetical protein [Anaerolineales bacterium]
MLKRLIFLLFALIAYLIVHEGLHALIAVPFGEFSDFLVKPYGFEVIFVTPPAERSGIHWLFISGMSNFATIILGYILLSQRERIAQIRIDFIRSLGYWVTLLFLLADPLNLSIGPFIYGGDALGISLGSGINIYFIQAVFLVVFLVNRELIAQYLLPAFRIETKHPLLLPWLRFRGNQSGGAHP